MRSASQVGGGGSACFERLGITGTSDKRSRGGGASHPFTISGPASSTSSLGTRNFWLHCKHRPIFPALESSSFITLLHFGQRRWIIVRFVERSRDENPAGLSRVWPPNAYVLYVESRPKSSVFRCAVRF